MQMTRLEQAVCAELLLRFIGRTPTALEIMDATPEIVQGIAERLEGRGAKPVRLVSMFAASVR